MITEMESLLDGLNNRCEMPEERTGELKDGWIDITTSAKEKERKRKEK